MSGLPVTIADIRRAEAAIAGTVARTPTVRAAALCELARCDVYLKLETLHPTGSFKERGALNKLLTLGKAERKAGVVAMSAGNHAQAVAYQAGRLGIAATIVMPENTPFTKVRRTQQFGARIVLVDDKEVRAVMTASWLRRMGWKDVFVLVESGNETGWPENPVLGAEPMRELRIDSAELAALLARDGFAVTGEIVPPKGASGDPVSEHARGLVGYVDAVNLTDNPLAPLMYGFSVLCCMSSAMSEPGGAGLGTLGFPEPVARRMVGEAGFTRFKSHEFDNPINAYYEVRP